MFLDGIKLSMNDFIVKAVGQTLQEVKSLNKVWKGEICEENPTSDISIAVATPGGLITPILKVLPVFTSLNFTSLIFYF